MSHKITTSTSSTLAGAATSSTKATAQQKKKIHARQESSRQSFAQRLEARQADAREARAHGEQRGERDALLTEQEIRQIGEQTEGTRLDKQLGQDVLDTDRFEQRLGEDNTLDPDKPVEDTPMDELAQADSRGDTLLHTERPEDEHAPAMEPVDGVEQVGSAPGQPEQVEETAPASSAQDIQQIARMAEQLVKACSVGQDRIARKVMLLDVEVPGKGQMRVRLTRDGDGMNVRLRASNDSTRSWLKSHQGQLRDQAASQGVVFKRIEVV